MNAISMNEEAIVVTSFYCFKNLPNYQSIKDPLLKFCKELDLKGTILLAEEGINSTISGARENIDQFYTYLTQDLDIPITNFKESFTDFKPFLKMKIRLKKEIVAMGVHDLDVSKYRGRYIGTNEWENFISASDVVVIDTRNKYETRLGTFKDALDPETRTFRQFPKWVKENSEKLKDKKIAMFCTGGVRCEKSTAFLKREGYDNVYHLEGGIIKYLEDTGNKSKLWQGNCFVFDDRVAVNDQLLPSSDLLCSGCGKGMTTDDVRDTAAYKRVICITCHDKERLQNKD